MKGCVEISDEVVSGRPKRVVAYRPIRIARPRELLGDFSALDALFNGAGPVRAGETCRPVKLGASTPELRTSAVSTLSRLACRIEWPDSTVALGLPGWREVGADFAIVPFLTAARHCA